ncbi:hypothetical protein FCOIX_1609 [Fusarium coicis]|nr:hypothetical protein FCOIX_1609 [Fusarium coicis]
MSRRNGKPDSVAAMNVATWELNLQNGDYQGSRLLETLSPADRAKCDVVLWIEFSKSTAHVIDSQNGFIGAAAHVFDRQACLLIRADDIWLAALALLKPHMTLHTLQAPIPSFTSAQIMDVTVVADCLIATVKAKFGEQVANTLIPRFSTTFAVDSGAAALILLGTNCQGHHPRQFGMALRRHDRLPIWVSGREGDWVQLQQTFENLRHRSQQVDEVLDQLSSFVADLRRAGRQFNGPTFYLAADKLNPWP